MQSTDRQSRHDRIIIGGCSGLIVLYLVSLLLPSLYTSVGWAPGWMPGFLCLALVPFAMAAPPWWANPLFFVGLVFLLNDKLVFAFRCGFVATILSLSTPFLLRDGSVGPGYFTWLACMIGLTWLAWFAHTEQARR